jgi:fatty acid desaturase
MDMVSKFTLYGLVRRIARALLPSIRSGAREAFGKSNPYAHPVSFALSQVPLIGLFTWARAWWAYPVFWLLPLVILPGLLNGLRMLGEHGGLTRREGPQVLSARTTMGSVGRSSALARLERVILSPFNFNLHHEHHLFPQLPYHVLPALHNHLLSSGYYAAHPDVLSPSYANTFRKLVGGKSVTAP